MHSHRQSTKQAARVQHAIGEPPLVVVPSKHLDQTPANPCVVRIEITGRRIVVEIDGDERLFVTGQRACCVPLCVEAGLKKAKV